MDFTTIVKYHLLTFLLDEIFVFTVIPIVLATIPLLYFAIDFVHNSKFSMHETWLVCDRVIQETGYGGSLNTLGTSYNAT